MGTYSSPHLERINERIARNGEPIADEDFAEMIAAVADLEGVAGVRPSYFEAVTAAGFRWFADVAVDVAVVEVGMLGRWDATNVADARVAVVTNVELDHTDYAGPTRADIAREKAGIVDARRDPRAGGDRPRPGRHLRRPSTPPPPTTASSTSTAWRTCSPSGGASSTLRTPFGHLPRRVPAPARRPPGRQRGGCPLRRRAFFDAPLDAAVVEEGFAAVTMPGRFEVLHHQPLVIVDGAHNPAGAEACAQVLDDDFDPAGDRLLVVGCCRAAIRWPCSKPCRSTASSWWCAARPVAPGRAGRRDLARAARAAGADDVVVVPSVTAACDALVDRADGDDAVLVTGSVYTVGAARPHLQRVLT